jgi:hypothetical protein
MHMQATKTQLDTLVPAPRRNFGPLVGYGVATLACGGFWAFVLHIVF